MTGHGDHPTRAALSLVDAYEDLRASATGGPASAGGLGGRAILARQGMAAWIRAVAQAELPPTPPSRSTTPTILSASVHREVINVLTTMALTTALEVRI